MRSSTALASFMGFYLNLLLDNVRLIHDTSVSEVYEQVFRIHEGDVFIGISYPRYSSRTIKAMQFAKSTGATAIGITDGRLLSLCGGGGYQSLCQERHGILSGLPGGAHEPDQRSDCGDWLPAAGQPVGHLPPAGGDLERVRGLREAGWMT